MARTGVTRDLLLPVAIAIVALLLWNTPVVYPLKIFVVFLHELSHGLAAIVTGGRIERIELSAAEGGLCVTRGGSPFWTSSAGYLGSLLWGALLLVLASRSRMDRLVAAALGLLTLGVTLLYVRSAFGFAYGLLAGAALAAAAWRLPAAALDLLLRVIGVVSCLYAVWDIGSDVLFRDVPGSDAHALATLTGIPAVVWGVIWVVIALAVCGLTLRATLYRTE
jgi:hypothetical protein